MLQKDTLAEIEVGLKGRNQGREQETAEERVLCIVNLHRDWEASSTLPGTVSMPERHGEKLS